MTTEELEEIKGRLALARDPRMPLDYAVELLPDIAALVAEVEMLKGALAGIKALSVPAGSDWGNSKIARITSAALEGK